MKLKNVPSVNIDLFYHNKTDKSFTSERSHLRTNLLNRIYDDAIDVGFVITNPTKNTSVTVFLESEEFDDEGDLTTQIFRPISSDIDKFPQLKDYKFIVFND
jgi:hypothetical protein